MGHTVTASDQAERVSLFSPTAYVSSNNSSSKLSILLSGWKKRLPEVAAVFHINKHKHKILTTIHQREEKFVGGLWQEADNMWLWTEWNKMAWPYRNLKQLTKVG